MDELYGLHSTATDYSVDNYLVNNYAHSFPPPVAGFGDRIPLFRPDRLLSGSVSSVVSDAASMVAEIQRGGAEEEVSGATRAKIASHPLYPKLLQAYIDCQKQTYCDILAKYKSDLERPFDEATSFLNDIEVQLNTLCNDEVDGSSDEDVSGGETEECQRADEDRELKDKLLRKYSGYISSLKHEFSKKKKKGKLPKEARQILLDWWNIHYKWPYPTEVDKVALAELTGLDQKQINNWFINQRKRHWKPSENMQFAVMDSIYGPLFRND
ncbi:hypothetical protein FH972_019159 [Carpinus fangiana]|uniref:Homeobox domain-containing protein n=1 Tax=Carpinus fangiana TaxID=176857 RepID=A0A5N6RQT2_9ROSI|nr:hypothetical protein FH972_019159 [Carpinus fangiana]